MKFFTWRQRLCAALVSGCAVAAATAAQADPQTFSVAGHGSISLTVPDQWTAQMSQPPTGMPPTIRILPKSGSGFEVYVTPLWAPHPDPSFGTSESLRKVMEQARDMAAKQSEEGQLKLTDIKGTKGTGYYFSATDKAPTPGEYKFLTQGMIPLSDLVLSFAILTGDPHSEVVDEALTMIRAASRPTSP